MAESVARYQDIHLGIVFTDHSLPDGNGISLIRRVRNLDAGVQVVMITAHSSITMAVEAIRAGADDYLTKPIALEELGLLSDRLVSRIWA